MNIREVEKSSFSIIGKEGLGKAQEADIWIPPLWQEATNAFEEIIHLIKQPLTIWGAMSDESGQFKPWNNGGLYLAGVEVENSAQKPENWTKWTLPGFRYFVVETTTYEMNKTYSDMWNYFTQNDLKIVGAVQEHQSISAENPEELELWFPIERI